MTTLGTLAEVCGAELRGDNDLEIDGLLPLEFAGPSQISFFANKKYLAAAQKTQAGALVLAEPFDGAPKNLLIHREPYLAAAKLARFFHPPALRPAGIHKTAVVEPGATVSKTAFVGPLAVIEEGATIEDGAQIHAQVYIGPSCSIGRDTIIYAGAKLMSGTMVGARCVIHGGAVLGADGFGFAEDKDAEPGHVRVKVPQLGIVVIGDDVEIGANTTIDRATFGMTHVGAGTKIDNLVQVAHNVRTGEDCVLVAMSGISGSAKLGRRVILAGQAGIGGHITVGDDTMIQAQSALNKSVPAGSILGGTPAMDYKEWVKQMMALRFLDEIRKRVLVRKTHE